MCGEFQFSCTDGSINNIIYVLPSDIANSTFAIASPLAKVTESVLSEDEAIHVSPPNEAPAADVDAAHPSLQECSKLAQPIVAAILAAASVRTVDTGAEVEKISESAPAATAATSQQLSLECEFDAVAGAGVDSMSASSAVNDVALDGKVEVDEVESAADFPGALHIDAIGQQ